MNITISIPVGPRKNHRQYLRECIDSISSQLEKGDEILLVIDGSNHIDFAGIPEKKIFNCITLGVAACVNIGVAQACTEYVLLMNSDDKLMPGAIDAVRAAWKKHEDPKGWYYLNTMYSTGHGQKCASGVAMVCRSHFLEIGGYPPETAVGAPDRIFLSLMQKRGLITTYPVSDEFLHWHRVHNEQETNVRKPWKKAIEIVHETLLEQWR